MRVIYKSEVILVRTKEGPPGVRLGCELVLVESL